MLGRSPRPGILYPLTILLILSVAATVSRHIPGLERLRQAVQARAVDITALGSGATREILQRLQKVHLVPVEPSAERSPGIGIGESQTFSLDPIPPARLADVLQIDPRWLDKGSPIAVVLIADSNLEQLHANPFARGREWERPAFFAYLENGEMKLTTRVGVRIHGGWSRAVTCHRSYRIYFRNRYGLDHFPSVFFPTGGVRSTRVLIARVSHSVDSTDRPTPLLNPLAFDIARRIGSVVPQTKSVVFYLNGERQGMYQFVERMDRDYLLAHYGHEDFSLVHTTPKIVLGKKLDKWQWEPVSAVDKVKVGSPAVYEEFRQWAGGYADLDLKAIAARVDIDNLSRWLLTNLYCGNLDPFQGPLLRDLSQPDGKWRWLLWDFDTSFSLTRFPRPRLARFIDPPETIDPPDERSWLLKQLIESSPEYRDYLARLFVDTMNHRTTREFVVDTIRRYRNMAETFEVRSDHFELIQEFLLAQPKFIRRELRRALRQGPTFTARVRAPTNRELVIDGYPSGSSFTGTYYGGMFMHIAIAESDREAFSHWKMRGKKVKDVALRLQINGNIKVRAVFQGSDGRDNLAGLTGRARANGRETPSTL